MFKQLTRLSTKNQVRASYTASNAVLSQVVQMNQITKTALISIRAFGAQMSQVQKDFRTVPLPPIGEFATPQIEKRTRNINKIISDYAVSEDDLSLKLSKTIPDEVLQSHQHPTEYIFQEQRVSLDYAKQMTDRDVLLFNLPQNYTVEQVKELCKVKGTKVLEISIQKTIDDESIACVKLTLQSTPQVKVFQQSLYNTWIGDKKLKIQNKKEAENESFSLRTVIVTNLPIHYRAENLKKLYKSYGNIVNIEMLFEDVNIKEHMKNKQDHFSEQKNERIQHEINKAQQIIKDSIQTDQEYQQFLRSHLGQEEIERVFQNQGYTNDSNQVHENQMSVLDSQINLSIHNLMTQLQRESADISDSKQLLLKLKKDLESEVPSIDTQSAKQATQFTKVDNEREAVLRLVQYVNRNREQVDDDVLSALNEKINFNTLGSPQDPLQRLENLSRLELAEAYDNLYNVLSAREQLLEKRFQEQYRHFGLEERILFGRRDWSRENEMVKDSNDPFNMKTTPEDFISVTEQIHDVLHAKNLTPEQKLFYVVTGKMNPFKKLNFDKKHLATSMNPKLAQHRVYPVMDPTLTPTQNREKNPYYHLRPSAQEVANEVVDTFREEYDMPFDELYHKEKSLIDNVIKAFNDLKQKRERLPNPVGDRNFIEAGEVPEAVLIAANMHSESQFVRDQRRQNEMIMKNSLDGDSANAGNYQYLMQHQDEIDKMFDNGEISKKDYQIYKSMVDNFNKVNKGYAFITFSHSDEALIAQFGSQYLVADNKLLETIPMGNLDHKDLDKNFVINEMKNDSKLVNEIERLREAKKELDTFEKNIDKDLPKNIRMNEFRKMARDYIENSQQNDRDHIRRTPLEEEELNDKIRQLQKQNPDIDLTQLFDTERNEQIRKNQHKKAFQSYKTFQFLKNGVEFQNRRKQEMAKREEIQQNGVKAKDAHKFPPIEETLAQFVSKDGNFGILNDVQSFDKPGRKFNYSENDFVESYFGKDGLRRLGFENKPDNNRSSIFGFNETWKNRFQVEKYLLTPEIEQKQRRLDETSARDQQDLAKSIDLEFEMLQQSFDVSNPNHVQYRDKKHPSQPGKTYMSDLQQKIESYSKRRDQIAEDKKDDPVFKPSDIEMIKYTLNEEYYPKPVKRGQEEDTKATEKFEPNYEGKRNQDNSDDSDDDGNNQEDDANEPTGQYIDPSLRRANNRVTYKYNEHLSNNPDYDSQKDGNETLQRYESIAEENSMDTSELLDKLKRFGPLDEKLNGDGQFMKKEAAGSLKSDFDIKGRQRQSKSLQTFVEDSMSEREDEDIYSHYFNKMNEAKKQQKEEQSKLNKEQKIALEEANKFQDMFPEIPRFQGFFKSQAEGKHPFEDSKFDMPEYTQQDKEKQLASDEYFEELYQRELSGRLLGGNLTPRQFAIMYGATGDDKLKIKLQQGNDREQSKENRRHAALLLELKEQYRRRKVLSGEWTEAESNKRLHEDLQEKMNKMLENKDYDKEMKEKIEAELMFRATMVHQRLQEKEYYFDEGLGVSVNDHIKKIQRDFPDLEVSVRRDRDGYPVIKTLYKPKFKYNLDSFLNFDAQKEHQHLKETTEILLSTLLPLGKGAKDLSSLTKEQLEQSLQTLMPYNLNNQERFDFDAATHQKLSKLVDERMEGRFRNDSEGFAQAILKFNETATYDKTRRINDSIRIAKPKIDYKETFANIDQEFDTMQTELMQQIMMRVKDHLYATKKKQSDFVKPRRSEISMFGNQVQHHENSASNLQSDADMLEQEPDFDKESYRQLKAEIKKRREAKERLLQQGFPELKPYMTF